MEKEPIRILLVEDDVNEVEDFKKVVSKRNDATLISITNSSTKAIEDYTNLKPDAVILDLELSDGEGSGFEFIEKMKERNTRKLSKIVVTTNVHSNAVYDFCHKSNIDFIFYKKQKNYSKDNIINTLLLLRNYSNNNMIINAENNEKTEENNEDKKEDRIMSTINKEMDIIGISTHLIGRRYLMDAIYYIIQDDQTSIIQNLSKEYKKSASTISRAMQNAILHAWRITPIDELEKIYTARINYETGVPTPTEFIYFYVDKIKKML